MLDQILFYTFCAVLLTGTVLCIFSMGLIFRGIYRIVDSLELMRHYEAREAALRHHYNSRQAFDPQEANAVGVLESDFNAYRQGLHRGSVNTYDADVESVDTGFQTFGAQQPNSPMHEAANGNADETLIG